MKIQSIITPLTHQIAKTAHEVNKAYCKSIGDNSQSSWDDAPAWQKDSAIEGVRFLIEDPEATPEDSHLSWLKHKYAEGWSYGEVKDPEKKEHPCMVSYRELPAEQQVKDLLFHAVVHSFMLDLEKKSLL